MALNERQLRLYTDVFDFYKPLTITETRQPYNGVGTLRYPTVPTYSSVKCFRHSGPEFDRGHSFGRENKEDSQSLMDVLSMDQEQEIGQNWAVQQLTPGDPDYGTWFSVVGDSDVNNFFANKKQVFIKRNTKAPGVA